MAFSSRALAEVLSDFFFFAVAFTIHTRICRRERERERVVCVCVSPMNSGVTFVYGAVSFSRVQHNAAHLSFLRLAVSFSLAALGAY